MAILAKERNWLASTPGVLIRTCMVRRTFVDEAMLLPLLRSASLTGRNRMGTRRALMATSLAALALLAAAISAARADPVAEFYRGKQVRLIVGYGPGGGYDVYA